MLKADGKTCDYQGYLYISTIDRVIFHKENYPTNQAIRGSTTKVFEHDYKRNYIIYFEEKGSYTSINIIGSRLNGVVTIYNSKYIEFFLWKLLLPRPKQGQGYHACTHNTRTHTHTHTLNLAI